MHPAKSVIFFTTASGAGYGLMVWLGMAALFGLVPMEAPFGFVAFGLSFVLIVSGLLSSTLHLGHPERAWRALSQWRSSWLSREGVAAVLAFGPMGLFALAWIFGGPSMTGISVMLGAAAAMMALITVYCTAMIYASLKAIPAWHNNWTPVAYLVFSMMTGCLLLACLAALWGYEGAGALSLCALVLLIVGVATKFLYWRSVEQSPPVSTSGTATGLQNFGKVNLIDAPHTDENYLLEEMGFRVARKHAAKLRRIAVALGFVVPFIAVAICAILDQEIVERFLLVFAVATCGTGIVVERWLFFAQAKHVVTLYYGEHQI